MRISRREAEILEFVAGRQTSLKEVARALGLKGPNATGYVKKLEWFGLLSSVRTKRKRIISLDSGVSFRWQGVKATFPQLRMDEVFMGFIPFLLSFAKDRKAFRLRDLDLSVATAKRVLARLRNLGLISMPKKGVYQLRREAKVVAIFCRNTLMQAYSTGAKHELGQLDHAIFSFDSARELAAVFVTMKDTKTEGYWPTFYSVAHEYGLRLLPAGKHYYTNAKPNLGDVIIHTLALEKGTRGAMYASVLALKNKYYVYRLLAKRQTFGLGRKYIKEFVEFILSKGRKPFDGLVSFEELGAVGYEARRTTKHFAMHCSARSTMSP